MGRKGGERRGEKKHGIKAKYLGLSRHTQSGEVISLEQGRALIRERSPVGTIDREGRVRCKGRPETGMLFQKRNAL